MDVISTRLSEPRAGRLLLAGHSVSLKATCRACHHRRRRHWQQQQQPASIGCSEFNCGRTDVRTDGRTFLPGLLRHLSRRWPNKIGATRCHIVTVSRNTTPHTPR